MEYPIWLVVVMGMGIVFIGLVSIIVLSTVMSGIVRAMDRLKNKTAVNDRADETDPEEKGRIAAAVSAAIAENLGTTPEAIRIVSVKKI